MGSLEFHVTFGECHCLLPVSASTDPDAPRREGEREGGRAAFSLPNICCTNLVNVCSCHCGFEKHLRTCNSEGAWILTSHAIACSITSLAREVLRKKSKG